MNNFKETKGITLVALIITVVILLILAGITLNATIGENGLISKAKDAKKETEIASIKEEIQMDLVRKQKTEKNVTDEMVIEILEKYGTLSEEEKLGDKILKTKENYEIKVSDVWNGTTKANGGKEDDSEVDDPKEDKPEEPYYPGYTKVANKPDIKVFNEKNTYYVSWDLTRNPYTIKDYTLISETEPSDWYDYTAGVNHWANIKTTGGGNECYWVWIPRYAYKVPTKGSVAETIEVKFLKNDTNIPIDESSITISNNLTEGSWNVHPAFTDEGNGGLGELTGIWVAKYEASSSIVDTIYLENGSLKGDTESLNGTGGGTDTSLHVRIKPNVTSWRGLSSNEVFEVCQKLTTSGNSLENTKKIDSHMMKNTEWGACAYLSSSKYGKTDGNGNRSRIYNNPYYKDFTTYATITGLAGESPTLITPLATSIYVYNTPKGIEASTTGNVYGIYDMAGGAWELTAAIYREGTPDDNISRLWDSSNSKYVDKYTGTTGSQENYFGNTKYGDAIAETSKDGASVDGAWDSSISMFPNSYLTFERGGSAGLGNYAGIFAFSYADGKANTEKSFRPVLSRNLSN